WIATWQTRATFLFTVDGDLGDVYAARSTDNGTTWSAPIPISTSPTQHDWMPVVTAASPGRIFVSRSTDNGATWSDALEIQADERRGNDFPEIAYDGADTWMIAWSSFDGEYQDRRLRLARSIDAGQTWTLIPATDIDGTLGGTYVFRTRIAGEPAGNWVVTWESHSIYGPDTDIFMIQSFDGGLTWKAPRYLNSLAAIENDGNDYAASVATDGEGGWLSAWTSNPGYYPAGSAYGALLFSTGSDGDVYVARGRFMACSPTPRAGCESPAARAGAKLVIRRDAVTATGRL